MWRFQPGRWFRSGAGLALLSAFLLLGALATPAAAQEDTPPIIGHATVSPVNLSHDGGTITISAEVTDDVGLMMVYAEILDQNGSPTNVPLQFQDGITYGASALIPPNFGDAPVSYFVNVVATDTNGATETKPVGDVQVDAPPPFDEAPIVGEITVTPRDLPSAGGAVTIRAVATDNLSITFVRAVVTAPGGATTDVELEPISATEFEGVFNAPANSGASSAQYSISVIATDDLGQDGTGNGGTFTVAGAAPTDQSLKLTPGKLSFGKVVVGRKIRHQVTLRNSARKPGAAISGVLLSPGAPFKLIGASSQPGSPPLEGIAFSLRPGERRVFTIEFRPTEVGTFQSDLVVRRNDGGQAGLSVRLTGKGQRKPGR